MKRHFFDIFADVKSQILLLYSIIVIDIITLHPIINDSLRMRKEKIDSIRHKIAVNASRSCVHRRVINGFYSVYLYCGSQPSWAAIKSSQSAIVSSMLSSLIVCGSISAA